MLDMLARNWWLFAIRGTVAILFGLAAFFWPVPTIVVLVLLFGVWALIDGLSILASLVRGDPQARRHAWAMALIGVLGVIVGIVTLFAPGWTALSIAYIVAFWAIVLGIFQVAAAIELRREIEGEVWLAVGGVISILFGIYVGVLPGPGLISLVWLLAIWAIVFGITSLLVAWRLRDEHASHRAALGT